jgi:hypothetical protein
MHHIDKVAFLETNPYLLLHLQEPIVTFWAVGNGTSTTSVSFLLLQETTKLSSSVIKIDAFLITDIIFQEGINYFYVLLFCFVSG